MTGIDPKAPVDLVAMRASVTEELRLAIDRALPYVSYKELSELFRQATYAVIGAQRERLGKKTSDIADIYGVSPQAVYQMGDLPYLKVSSHPARRVLELLQDAGERGHSKGGLAAAYYSAEEDAAPSRKVPDMSFDEALDLLCRLGDAERTPEGRYSSVKPQRYPSAESFRRLVLALAGCRDTGLRKPELARAYYDGPEFEGLDGLEPALESALAAGLLSLEGGRYTVTGEYADLARVGGLSQAEADALVTEARKIADRARDPRGRGDAHFRRVDFWIPGNEVEDADRAFMGLRKVVIDAAVALEDDANAGDARQSVTVLLACSARPPREGGS